MTADLWTGQETLVPAALRGYRSWSVRDGKLHSTGVSHVWDAPEVAARCFAPAVGGGSDPDCPCDLCVRNTHVSPVRDCSCGIYGWYRPGDSRLVEADVFGAVEASGRVVLASHGFRAEKVRMLALAIESPGYQSPLALSMSFTLSFRSPASAEDLHTIARWAKKHGVPVFPTRADLLAEFPPQDVSSLVQHDCTEECSAHRHHGSRIVSASFLSNAIASGTYTYAKPLDDEDDDSEPDASPTSRAHRWVAVAMLLLAIVGWTFGAIALAHGSRFAGLVGVTTNAVLIGVWTRWIYKRRSEYRRPHKDGGQ